MSRTPYDGQPFYCKLCGAGWGEYGACEEPNCTLEDAQTAQQRAAKRKAEATGASHD